MCSFKFILSFILILLHTDSALAEGYIKCRVSSDTATAYYCNLNGSGSTSGTVVFDVYNENGAQISSAFCVGVAVAVMGCSALCSVPAPSDAFECRADVN